MIHNQARVFPIRTLLGVEKVVARVRYERQQKCHTPLGLHELLISRYFAPLATPTHSPCSWRRRGIPRRSPLTCHYRQWWRMKRRPGAQRSFTHHGRIGSNAVVLDPGAARTRTGHHQLHSVEAAVPAPSRLRAWPRKEEYEDIVWLKAMVSSQQLKVWMKLWKIRADLEFAKRQAMQVEMFGTWKGWWFTWGPWGFHDTCAFHCNHFTTLKSLKLSLALE